MSLANKYALHGIAYSSPLIIGCLVFFVYPILYWPKWISIIANAIGYTYSNTYSNTYSDIYGDTHNDACRVTGAISDVNKIWLSPEKNSY